MAVWGLLRSRLQWSWHILGLITDVCFQTHMKPSCVFVLKSFDSSTTSARALWSQPWNTARVSKAAFVCARRTVHSTKITWFATSAPQSTFVNENSYCRASKSQALPVRVPELQNRCLTCTDWWGPKVHILDMQNVISFKIHSILLPQISSISVGVKLPSEV